jgi:hypothetical protein
MRNVSDKICGKKHIYIFCQKSCRLLDNVEKYGTAGEATDDKTVWRMRFARWVTMATNTHSKFSIITVFLRQQWIGE